MNKQTPDDNRLSKIWLNNSQNSPLIQLPPQHEKEPCACFALASPTGVFRGDRISSLPKKYDLPQKRLRGRLALLPIDRIPE